jgi:signal transduction histidine kinase
MLEGAIHDETGYQRAATIINEEASRMSKLIGDLLQLAQLESGSAIGDRILVSPSELASHAADRMRLAAGEAGLSISLSLPETVPMVRVDRDHLEQAICNLLDNAINHTPPPGVIEVAVRPLLVHRGRTSFTTPPVCPLAEMGDGHWVTIQIRDTGCGIAAEDLPHIFERFYRVDKSRSGSGKAGLGLAIAKEILEAHGGVIQVQSQPELGSCFSILLPVTSGSIRG